MRKCIFLVVIVCMLAGCTGKVNDDFFAMDTYMTAEVYGTNEDVDSVKAEVYRIDNLLRWDNVDEKNPEVLALVKRAQDIFVFTNGAFDITVSPFLEIWGFRDKNYKIPSETELSEAFARSQRGFDFGGIGKGYAGEKIRDMLLKRGVKSAIISLGGNIQTVGSKPDGKPWKVGIQNPDGDGYVGYVSVTDEAVVTSGGYHRYFEAGGKRYSHIIDPKTGCPAQTDVKSVSVVSADGTLADALSTAFYVMGKDAAIEFCERVGFKYNNTEFAVVVIDFENDIQSFGNVKFTVAS